MWVKPSADRDAIRRVKIRQAPDGGTPNAATEEANNAQAGTLDGEDGSGGVRAQLGQRAAIIVQARIHRGISNVTSDESLTLKPSDVSFHLGFELARSGG